MNVQALGLVNILSKCLFILKSCLDDKYLSLWWDTGSRKRWEFRRCTGNILLIAVIRQWLTGLCLVMSKWALDNHEIIFFVKWRAMKWATGRGLSANGLAIILMFVILIFLLVVSGRNTHQNMLQKVLVFQHVVTAGPPPGQKTTP